MGAVTSLALVISCLAIELLAGCGAPRDIEPNAYAIPATHTIGGDHYTYESAGQNLTVAVLPLTVVNDLNGQALAARPLRVSLKIPGMPAEFVTLLVAPGSGHQIAYVMPCVGDEKGRCIEFYTVNYGGRGLLGPWNLDVENVTNSLTYFRYGSPSTERMEVSRAPPCVTVQFDLLESRAGLQDVLAIPPDSATYCNGGSMPQSLHMLGQEFRLVRVSHGTGPAVNHWSGLGASPGTFSVSDTNARTGLSFPEGSGFPDPFGATAAINAARNNNKDVDDFFRSNGDAQVTYFASSGDASVTLTPTSTNLTVSHTRQIHASSPQNKLAIGFGVTQTVHGGVLTTYNVDGPRNRPIEPGLGAVKTTQATLSDVYNQSLIFEPSRVAGMFATRTIPVSGEKDSGPALGAGYLYYLQFAGPVIGEGLRLDYSWVVNAGTGQIVFVNGGATLSKLFDLDLAPARIT